MALLPLGPLVLVTLCFNSQFPLTKAASCLYAKDGRTVELYCGSLDCCEDHCCRKNQTWAIWYLWFSCALVVMFIIATIYFCWRYKKQQRMNRVVSIMPWNSADCPGQQAFVTPNGTVFMIPPPSYRTIVQAQQTWATAPTQNSNLDPPPYPNQAVQPHVPATHVTAASAGQRHVEAPPAYDSQRTQQANVSHLLSPTPHQPHPPDTVRAESVVPQVPGQMTESPRQPAVKLPPLDLSGLATDRSSLITPDPRSQSRNV